MSRTTRPGVLVAGLLEAEPWSRRRRCPPRPGCADGRVEDDDVAEARVFASRSTRIRWPIASVGIIEPLGILYGLTRNAWISRASAIATRDRQPRSSIHGADAVDLAASDSPAAFPAAFNHEPGAITSLHAHRGRRRRMTAAPWPGTRCTMTRPVRSRGDRITAARLISIVIARGALAGRPSRCDARMRESGELSLQLGEEVCVHRLTNPALSRDSPRLTRLRTTSSEHPSASAISA